ncbi:MAG TPA: hypothetical protein VGC77_06780 [Rhodopseudomonas sp.]
MRRTGHHTEYLLQGTDKAFHHRLASLTALVALGMVLAPAIGFVMLLVD